MNAVICGIIVVFLALQALSWVGNWPCRWRYRHIPGPTPSVLLGNAVAMRKKKNFYVLSDWQSQYGDVFKIFLVRQPAVVISDPTLVRQVTIKDFNKFHDRFPAAGGMPPAVFGGNRLKAHRASMLHARGSQWGSLRAAVQPMFHSTSLEGYASTINKAVDALIANLGQLAKSGEQVDLNDHIGRLTMQVIGAVAFGVDFKTQSSQHATDIPLITAAQQFFTAERMSPWALMCMLVPGVLKPAIKLVAQAFPDSSMQKATAATSTVYDACSHLIENSRRLYNSGSTKPGNWTWFKSDPNNPYKDVVPAENSVISMLQKANNKATGAGFEPLEIASQANIMVLAGYETTANALAFCIYLLSKHPDAQQRLIQEVDCFSGSPSYDDLSQFPFVRAVINEVLRLYPGLPMLIRTSQVDVQVGKYFIPKQTMVQIPVWSMHHDKRWWQDPYDFKPERWMNDKHGGDRSGGLAYMPFGLGSHNCVGMKLALEEAIIALVRLYQKYTFVLDARLLNSPVEIRAAGITLSPKELLVTVKAR